jgi:hypothetical protein
MGGGQVSAALLFQSMKESCPETVYGDELLEAAGVQWMKAGTTDVWKVDRANVQLLFWSRKRRFIFPTWMSSIKGTRLEVFIRGRGWFKFPAKDFVEGLAPILDTMDPWEVSKYSSTFGEHATKSCLDRKMAGIMVDGQYAMLMRCASSVPRKFAEEFKAAFEADLAGFYEYYNSVFGRWSFDLPAFDEWLHKHRGYDEEKNGSLKDFLTARWGEGFADRFKQYLVKA